VVILWKTDSVLRGGVAVGLGLLSLRYPTTLSLVSVVRTRLVVIEGDSGCLSRYALRVPLCRLERLDLLAGGEP
jgi:hypothetical protein